MARALPSHLDVPWKTWQAVMVAVLAWLVVPFVAVLIIAGLAPVFPPAAQLADALRASDVGAYFGLDLINAGAALALVAWYLRRYHVGWASVGWRKTSFWRTVLYFAITFVIFLVVSGLVLALVSWLDPSFNADQAQTNEYTTSIASHRSITLIALVLIPPIIEETVFRGFIFPAIAKKWGIVAGAVISSALFGLAHWQANISLYTFVLGLVLCFLYVKLKSIFPGMALHMLNNFLAYYALSTK